MRINCGVFKLTQTPQFKKTNKIIYKQEKKYNKKKKFHKKKLKKK